MILFVKKHYDKIFACISIVLALIIRFLCRDFESIDYEIYLKDWVNFFRENGGWYGLSRSISNYNVVYQYILVIISYIKFSDLYLIKIISCVFDFLLAVGCAKILEAAGISKERQSICFSLILLLPTIWLNSAYWGQCDSIYVCFIVWSIYFLLKHKNYLSVIFVALAFTFKLQTIFIIPLYFIQFLRKNIKCRHIIAFPITYLITCVPALCFGKPFMEIIGIYSGQAAEYDAMSMNSPSIIQFFDIKEYNHIVEKVSILAAFIFALVICIVAIKRSFEAKHIISLCALFSLGIPFFLPHMHERYFYMAGIFAAVYAFTFSKKRIWLVFLTEIVSLTLYLYFFHFINLYCGVVSSYIFTRPNSAAFIFVALVSMLIYYYYDYLNKKTDVKPIRSFVTGIACVLVLFVIVQAVKLPYKTFAKVDNQLVNFNEEVIYEHDGWTLVPLRSILNAGGYNILYDKELGSSVISKDNVVIATVNLGEDEMILNGEAVQLKHECCLAYGYSYVADEDLAKIMNMNLEKYGNIIHFKSKNSYKR